MVVDVWRAHWNADARRTIYIQLLEEDWEEGMCGLALKSLYGFLVAASCWNDEVGNMLAENGFTVGAANPALFRHEEQDVLGLVHGDDFITLADDVHRLYRRAQLLSWGVADKVGSMYEDGTA